MSKLIKSSRVCFTQTPNEIAQNPNLSFKARGLWTYLESKPENWKFSAKRISEESIDGIDSVNTAIRELERNGYLERKKAFAEGGFFDGYDYIIHIVPIIPSMENPLMENPLMENPSTEKPSMENPLTYKQRDKNKDIETKNDKFFKYKDGIKIFQIGTSERYQYELGKYIIFADNSDRLGGKRIVPDVFMSRYLLQFHELRYEGLLRMFEGDIQTKKAEFDKVCEVLFRERTANVFNDIEHFINTFRKTSNEMKTRKTNTKPTFKEKQERVFVNGQDPSTGW